jgi:hypothetical protein
MIDLLRRAGNAVNDAAVAAIDTVGQAGGAAVGALPSAGDMKRHVGQALIVGGKFLIDPRVAVGEMAVSLGTSLIEDSSPEWLVLEANSTRFLPLFRGSEDNSRRAYEAAIADGKTVILCQVLAAQAGA